MPEVSVQGVVVVHGMGGMSNRSQPGIGTFCLGEGTGMAGWAEGVAAGRECLCPHKGRVCRCSGPSAACLPSSQPIHHHPVPATPGE